MATETAIAPARDRQPAALDAASPGKVVIIGAGIAGLSCGCYLQMSGVQSEILESGALPGGLCMSWNRGDYVFDGCMRWLLGTDASSVFHQVWSELGAIGNRRIFAEDEVIRIEGADGEVLSVSSDLDALAAELKRISPVDGPLIDDLTRAARRCARLDPPLDNPVELLSLPGKIRLGLSYLPMLPVILRWKGVPITSYVERYRSRFLREALVIIAGDERMSALVLVMVLAYRSLKNTGFVSGGSQAFADAIAARYTALGGVVRYGERVAEILVDGDRATGVRCADGTVVPATTVVSCADGHTTLFQMLRGRFLNRNIRYLYENGDLFSALIQVSLGINQAFFEAPRSFSLPLVEPLEVDDQTRHSRLDVTFFNSATGLCPEGKTVVSVRLKSRCEFWTRLRKETPERYRQAKTEILDKVVKILDDRFPGLAANLETTDVATPFTYIRYTGNWQASHEGWLPSPRVLGRRLPFTLPGLQNFYMAGHWVIPGGGLPSAALSGRYVAQMICARQGKAFRPATP